jgi:UDP-N-acetylglucosamine 1-carboxyvinyltransferase
MAAVIDILRAAGVDVDWQGSTAHVRTTGAPRPVDVTALPYPGIPTDVQAQLTALLSLADGISVVTDKVFPDRFMHIPELMRLGAAIRREGASAIISGRGRLSGASVMASDLRASAALLLAALAADGETVIRRVYHLDRGYERLERKLNLAGASIQRVPDEQENPATPLPWPGDESGNGCNDMPPSPKFLRRQTEKRDVDLPG